MDKDDWDPNNIDMISVGKALLITKDTFRKLNNINCKPPASDDEIEVAVKTVGYLIRYFDEYDSATDRYYLIVRELRSQLSGLESIQRARKN